MSKISIKGIDFLEKDYFLTTRNTRLFNCNFIISSTTGYTECTRYLFLIHAFNRKILQLLGYFAFVL